MNYLGTLRIPFLIEEDNGLAYLLADMEAGYLGSNDNRQTHKQNGFFSRFFSYSWNSSDNYSTFNIPRIISSSSSSSSSSSWSTSKFYDTRFEERQPHFLDVCFLCKKRLMSNDDIFMYRGDTPFCSVECRWKQIMKDEVNEKRLQHSVKALRNMDQRKSTSTTKAYGYTFHTSTTIAAA